MTVRYDELEFMDKTKHQQIVILGTGGTIAGQAENPKDSVNYTAALVDISELLDTAKGKQQDGVQTLNHCEVIAEQLIQIDSKDMSFDVWKRLLSRCQALLSQEQVQAIIITHGTDTLEETAYFLHSMLRAEKPVILTCAMRPANASDSDGPQNLRDALTLASSSQVKGVLVVCAGEVHGAQNIQKLHTTRLNAFSSGEAELIGHFVDGNLNLSKNALGTQAQDSRTLPLLSIKDFESAAQLPRVEIIMNHADANGQIVNALLEQKVILQHKLRGIVVAGTGNGTISASLESALLRAQESGVVVWRSSRCAFGQLEGRTNAVFGDSHGLPSVKARIALMLNLMHSDLNAMKS